MDCAISFSVKNVISPSKKSNYSSFHIFSSPGSCSSLGGAGGSFNPRGLCEAELLEQPRCRISLHATDPPHASLPAVARLPTGGIVKGARPGFCGREVIPAVVSCWTWFSPQAGLEQD